MFYVIGVIVVALIILGILYRVFFGKRKVRKTPISQMSAPQKIVETMSTKLNKLMNDLSNRIRTPEVIRAEIEKLFDEYYKEKSQEFKNNLINISNTLTQLKHSLETMTTQKRNTEAKLVDIRAQYNATQDVNLAQMGAKFMGIIEKSNKTIELAKVRIKDLELLKTNVTTECEFFAANFNMKKSEVLLKITDATLTNTTAVDLKIDDLLEEFETKNNEMAISTQVDKILKAPQSEMDVNVKVEDFIKSCNVEASNCAVTE